MLCLILIIHEGGLCVAFFAQDALGRILLKSYFFSHCTTVLPFSIDVIFILSI